MRVCGSTVDIPPKYGDLNKFRSTVGHKANHKFVDMNVMFSHLDTPRYDINLIRNV